MDWFKQHADTLAILAVFACCFWTLNEKMNDRFNQMDYRFSQVEKDLTVIKNFIFMS